MTAYASGFVNIMPSLKGFQAELERQLNCQMGDPITEQSNKAKKTLASMAQSMGTKLNGLGKSMSMAVTLPIAAIGSKAIKSSADFGVSMASMRINSGATGAEMKNLNSLAIKMGQDTVFSAGEAANAMLELSKGGMSVASIQGGALAASMNLASTEGMGLAEASSIVIQSMNTFGLDASEAGKAVDILAAGAVASTASIQDLADGMKYVGSTAKSLNIPMSDTVTAMAAMNNAGIDSTTAGSSLNRMFLGLLGTTKGGAQEIKKLGLSFIDASGSVKPMTSIVEELTRTYSGMTDAAKAQSLKNIFGVEGMRAANVLISTGSAEYSKLTDAVSKQGVASDLSKARMAGLAGVIETLSGSIDTALLKAGDNLAPTFTGIATSITGVINAFAAMSPEMQKNVVNIALFLAATGPVLATIGKMTTGVVALSNGFGFVAGQSMTFGRALLGIPGATGAPITAMGKLGAAIRNHGGAAFASFLADQGRFVKAMAISGAATIKDVAIKSGAKIATLAMAGASRVAAGAQWLLNAAMTANPIGLVIAGVAALTTGLVWFFTQTKVGQQAWANFSRFLGEAWNNIVGFVQNGVKVIVDLFLNWHPLGLIIKNWDAIIKFFAGLGSKFLKFGKNIVDGLWNGISNTWKTLTSGISNLIGGLISWVKGLLGIHSPSRVFAEIGNNITQGLVGGIVANSDKVMVAAENLAKGLKGSFADNIKNLGQAISDGLTEARDAFKNFRDEVSSSVVQGFSLSGAFQNYDDAKKKAKEDGEVYAGSFLASLQEAADKVTAFSAKVSKLLTSGLSETALQQVLSAGSDAGSSIADELISGGAQAIDKANSLVLATQAAADRVGFEAADKFKFAGLSSAQMLAHAFVTETSKKGATFARVMNVMDQLAASAGRTVKLDVVTNHSSSSLSTSSTSSKSVSSGGVGVSGTSGSSSQGAASTGLKYATPAVREKFNQTLALVSRTKEQMQVMQAQIASAMKMPDGLERKKKLNLYGGSLNSMIDSLAAAKDVALDLASKYSGLKLPVPFAKGGFVQQPVNALVGEAGPEVVTPLKDFERMMGLTKPSTRESTLNYYAAPNNSIDSEQELFRAMRLTKLV